MEGENSQKPDTKEKKTEAKKADTGGRLRRVTSRPKCLRRGSPTAAEPCPVRGIGRYFPLAMCSRKARYKRKYSAAEARIEKQKKEKILATVTKLVSGDTMVAPERLNFTKGLDTVQLKMCLESC